MIMCWFCSEVNMYIANTVLIKCILAHPTNALFIPHYHKHMLSIFVPTSAQKIRIYPVNPVFMAKTHFLQKCA